jgi:hypothetical protein
MMKNNYGEKNEQGLSIALPNHGFGNGYLDI